MDTSEYILTNTNDHIMANVWRLIFERQSRRTPTPAPRPIRDFSVLEQLLPEYRMIGLILADQAEKPRHN